ncbi:MAG: hypothetical protein OEO77_01890, partial [Acidimicrobiia bacterium]|nr:hypothetical protein [Acidimicrobiia bacterium]
TEINPERRIRTTTRVGASPVNEDGTVLAARAVSQVASLQVSALDPGGLPGFEDGLSSGWELLQIIWGSVVVSSGFIAGLAPLLALVFGFIWWQRRRRHAAREAAIPPVPARNADGSDERTPEEE